MLTHARQVQSQVTISKFFNVLEFFNRNVHVTDDARSSRLNEAIDLMGWKMVDPFAASLIVTDDVADLSLNVSWAALLHGLYVVEPSTVLLGNGAALKFREAINTQRWVFVSPNLHKEEPLITKVLSNAFSIAGTRWK